MILTVILCSLVAGVISSCNMPGVESSQADMNVTQAYQTVQARLTSAVGQTPVGTASPPPIQGTSPTATPSEETVYTPTINPTISPTSTVDPQVTSDRCDQAAAGYPKIDITVEDDTEFAPGEAFTKIWRVVNTGACTWTTDYSVVYFSGEIMGASSSQPLDTEVAPNQSVDIVVDMVAPDQVGTYNGNWKLSNPDGVMFGIGPGGESPFWVRIKVVSEVSGTSTPTPSLTPTVEVQVNGSTTLALDDTLDLDTLLVNSGGSDLKYRTTLTNLKVQLVPIPGAKLSVFGSTQPSLFDCQDANLTTMPIILDDLAVGTYICHQTNLGLPGWIRFESFDQGSGMVTLQVLTWKLP